MGIFSRKKTEAAVNEATEAAATEAAAAEEAAETSPDTLSEELIAVIAAAVGAYEAEQFRRMLHIQKINRTCGVRPAWGVMGTQEAIDTRRM